MTYICCGNLEQQIEEEVDDMEGAGNVEVEQTFCNADPISCFSPVLSCSHDFSGCTSVLGFFYVFALILFLSL